MIHVSIPSPPPEWSSFSLGPLTIHVYALCIVAGIFVGLWLATKRWVERGGDPDAVSDIAIWAIPMGIIGGRLYHVISTPGPYFGENGNPVDALKIWEGGLGIWGAVALGALGAYIGARRAGVPFSAFADAAAPAVLIAQAIGRLGNYFNQELFGGPTDLPWGLEIDPAFRPEGYEQFTTFHPTFLYEMIWNLVGAFLIIWLDRKYDLRGGRVFWLYVIVYVSGRLWIETVRIDIAVHVLGVRINVWVSIGVLALAIIMFVVMGRRQRGSALARVPRNQLAMAKTDVSSPADAEASEPADVDTELAHDDDDPEEETTRQEKS
ncbi:prolipoprotein diacylglyceryl transferase [Demequina sediminicola]|uniref:prolipoprotein diacylglyceryl transferase n=1 Tax=Demequina sediminicola TaxID=1095026 RepID=UPI000782A9DA|nr:prolipoprotein diacylglyceryl transferase [Demequina sediminicola]